MSAKVEAKCDQITFDIRTDSITSITTSSKFTKL